MSELKDGYKWVALHNQYRCSACGVEHVTLVTYPQLRWEKTA